MKHLTQLINTSLVEKEEDDDEEEEKGHEHENAENEIYAVANTGFYLFLSFSAVSFNIRRIVSRQL